MKDAVLVWPGPVHNDSVRRVLGTSPAVNPGWFHGWLVAAAAELVLRVLLTVTELRPITLQPPPP